MLASVLPPSFCTRALARGMPLSEARWWEECQVSESCAAPPAGVDQMVGPTESELL